MYYELSNLGLIKIQGNDVKKFLQGQLTCDVEAITTENSSMGAHCNPQGRIISLFYLFLFDENYYLLMQSSMIPVAMSALKKYAVFFKVELSDASHEFMILGCHDINPLSTQHVARIPVASDSSRFMLAGTAAAMKMIKEQITEPSHLASPDAWTCLDIHDGIPAIYPETSAKFLPHELNLDKLNAISFDKGCYTGQEIIARMHYRGKLKNRMYITDVSSASIPQRGTELGNQPEASEWTSGTIVDVCHDVYNNKYHVLIVANEQMKRGI